MASRDSILPYLSCINVAFLPLFLKVANTCTVFYVTYIIITPVYMQAERLQRVLDEDPAAVYRLLEGPEDKLSYNNNILELAISESDIERFQGITSLLVENPFDVRRYFRIAPGNFTGFGKLFHCDSNYFMSTYCFALQYC